MPPKSSLLSPAQKRLVIAGASTLCGVGNGSLKVDDADKGYTGGPKEKEREY